MADGDDQRILSSPRLVRNRLGEVLHERLEVLAGHPRTVMRKPASSIGGPLREAVMGERVAVAANSEFLHWLLRKRSRRGQTLMRAPPRGRRARFGLSIGGPPESIILVLSSGW